MSTYQKITILGNLGRDPEVKETKSDKKVAVLNIATSETWKDKNGEKQEATEWHRVELWQKQAEVAEEYLSKGDKALVEGKVKTDKWQDESGNDRYMVKIKGERLILMGGGSKSEKSEGGASSDPSKEGGDDVPF